MRYLRKTLQYLLILENGKRLLTLFLISVPAGIAASFAFPTESVYEWIKNYSVGNTNFWQNWTLGGSRFAVWMGLLAMFMLLIFSISVMASIVSRSLRVGVFKVERLIYEFNESFFPAFFTVLLYILAYIVTKTIITLFLVLWQTLKFKALSLGLSLFTFALLLCGASLLLSYTVMFLPTMSFNGLKARDALIASVRKCGGKARKILPAIALPIAVVIVIGSLIAIFEIPLLSQIIDSVLYSLLFAYLLSLSMISYYEIEQLKREDYPREYFFRKK